MPFFTSYPILAASILVPRGLTFEFFLTESEQSKFVFVSKNFSKFSILPFISAIFLKASLNQVRLIFDSLGRLSQDAL
jgi:hypothetical protein